ncbi:MAG: HAMP domain-containing histidine kinase, partial [Planctomycetes bacterium]|nr:HAMP domain-containing histidine kinase [Planctomycetota bacterium]
RKKSSRIFEVSQSVSKFAAPVAVNIATGNDTAMEPDWRSITADARSICDSPSHLDRLPAGLLRIGRVRNVEFAPNWLDMNTLLISVLTSLKPEIHEASAKVMFMDIPCCFGDDSLVREMFRALITNSIENLSPDRDGLIRIWGQHAGSRVIYCIEDNGAGIAAEEFEDIFEMFYRIKKGTGKQGIGLSLVKDVVSRHNGRIWLKSTPGKGSTFSVALPAR